MATRGLATLAATLLLLQACDRDSSDSQAKADKPTRLEKAPAPKTDPEQSAERTPDKAPSDPTPAASDTKPAAAKELPCDKQAIAQLAAELKAAPIAEARTRVWPGLEDACGKGIPNALSAFLAPRDPDKIPTFTADDTQMFLDLQERMCPGIQKIMMSAGKLGVVERAKAMFRDCDFARYGVIELADASFNHLDTALAFTVHQWMLDAGFEADTIRPITLALIPPGPDEPPVQAKQEEKPTGPAALGLVGLGD